MELHELHKHVKPTPPKIHRPVGIYILSGWFIFSMLMLLVNVFQPVIVFGGKAITGLPVVLYYLSLMMVFAYKTYGLLTKKKWAYLLIIIHEIYIVLFMLIFFSLYYFNQSGYVEAMSKVSGQDMDVLGAGFMQIIMAVGFLFSLIEAGIVLIYVMRKKDYFTE